MDLECSGEKIGVTELFLFFYVTDSGGHLCNKMITRLLCAWSRALVGNTGHESSSPLYRRRLRHTVRLAAERIA